MVWPRWPSSDETTSRAKATICLQGPAGFGCRARCRPGLAQGPTLFYIQGLDVELGENETLYLDQP
jgi:hypothetical protein